MKSTYRGNRGNQNNVRDKDKEHKAYGKVYIRNDTKKLANQTNLAEIEKMIFSKTKKFSSELACHFSSSN